MSTSVSSVVSHFPSAENGFTTTTSGSVSSGATTVGLNSVAGYSNGEIAVFVIDPDDTSKKQTFTGTIDTAGVQVTSVVWTAGTNQTHSSGATVVDYASATHISMISKGLLVEHDQDGTHSAITGTSINLTGSVTADTIAEKTPANGVTIDGLSIKDSALNTDASVIPSNLMASTGSTWAWQNFTPSLTNWSIGTGGNAATTAKYIQIGKTVFVKLKSILGTSGQSVSGVPTFNLPVTASANHVQFDQLGTVWMNAGGTGVTGYIRLETTATAKMFVLTANATYVGDGTISSTVPGTWAAGEFFTTQFFYEAA